MISLVTKHSYAHKASIRLMFHRLVNQTRVPLDSTDSSDG